MVLEYNREVQLYKLTKPEVFLPFRGASRIIETAGSGAAHPAVEMMRDAPRNDSKKSRLLGFCKGFSTVSSYLSRSWTSSSSRGGCRRDDGLRPPTLRAVFIRVRDWWTVRYTELPVEVAVEALGILRQHAEAYEQTLAGPLTLAELHY
jgi:hypothetical protein